METAQLGRELPRYKSHKSVWALKIKSIEDPNNATDGSRLMYFEEAGYSPVCVDSDYMLKHKPQVGGYYVVYADGYKSWSPAQAFEEGYAPFVGATGKYPDGKLNASDEGELQFGVAHKDGQVLVNFGKPVAWFAMPKETALQLAQLLTHHAQA